MSTDATAPSNASAGRVDPAEAKIASPNKGKGKSVPIDAMDEDDDDDDEEEEEEEEDDDVAEDDLEGIDPGLIRTSRTRGVIVDYTSEAALEKAGLKPESADDDEHEESFQANEDDMQDD